MSFPVTCMDDLPEELLEYILNFVDNYTDYQNVVCVSRKWYRVVKGIAQKRKVRFDEAVDSGYTYWEKIDSHPSTGKITERYSHCSCVLNGTLYIFGGSTSNNTTFNDLWKFELSTRHWTRPICSGAFPTPKACASMIPWKDQLILFGGWHQPPPFPLHQVEDFYNQLHRFNTQTDTWQLVHCDWSAHQPQPVAGHSVCLLPGRDIMLVYGGAHQRGVGTGDLLALDLNTNVWREVKDTGWPTPRHRYAAHLGALSPNEALVLGGISGPNICLSDCWYLKLFDDWTCQWSELRVDNQSFYTGGPLWYHPACKVGDKIVVLSKTNQELPPDLIERISFYRLDKSSTSELASQVVSSSSDDEQPAAPRQNAASADTPGSAAGGSGRTDRQRRRLEMLEKFERRVRGAVTHKKEDPPKHWLQSPMFLFALDISTYHEGFVSWTEMHPERVSGMIPEEFYFYSLNLGRAELVLFGGFDPKPTQNSELPHGTTNSLFIIQSDSQLSQR